MEPHHEKGPGIGKAKNSQEKEEPGEGDYLESRHDMVEETAKSKREWERETAPAQRREREKRRMDGDAERGRGEGGRMATEAPKKGG